MDILCCPICKGELALTATKQDKTDILAGNLRCKACNVDYPIEDGIPYMLPAESR